MSQREAPGDRRTGVAGPLWAIVAVLALPGLVMVGSWSDGRAYWIWVWTVAVVGAPTAGAALGWLLAPDHAGRARVAVVGALSASVVVLLGVAVQLAEVWSEWS
jgi:hypothetical protein